MDWHRIGIRLRDWSWIGPGLPDCFGIGRMSWVGSVDWRWIGA